MNKLTIYNSIFLMILIVMEIKGISLLLVIWNKLIYIGKKKPKGKNKY